MYYKYKRETEYMKNSFSFFIFYILHYKIYFIFYLKQFIMQMYYMKKFTMHMLHH